MKKGISAVIAIVLILMITVALAAMAYVWFTSVFTDVTESAGERVSGVGEATSTQISIESAAIVGTNIAFTVRNTGTVNATNFAVYVNDIYMSDGGLTSIAPGSIGQGTVTGGAGNVLKVTTGTGYTATATVR